MMTQSNPAANTVSGQSLLIGYRLKTRPEDNQHRTAASMRRRRRASELVGHRACHLSLTFSRRYIRRSVAGAKRTVFQSDIGRCKLN